jgi:hypothetical protein
MRNVSWWDPQSLLFPPPRACGEGARESSPCMGDGRGGRFRDDSWGSLAKTPGMSDPMAIERRLRRLPRLFASSASTSSRRDTAWTSSVNTAMWLSTSCARSPKLLRTPSPTHSLRRRRPSCRRVPPGGPAFLERERGSGSRSARSLPPTNCAKPWDVPATNSPRCAAKEERGWKASFSGAGWRPR